MDRRFVYHLFTPLLCMALLLPSFTWAADIELGELALPTEIKEMGKNPGSVYYSPTTKNKALMPVHFWGEVGKPGLHFIPLDTKLVKGLSLAGGGSSSAKLDEIRLTRVENGKVNRLEFNLEEGGDIKAHEFGLKPGDTVFVERDRFQENRSYYTALFSVALTIVSTLLLLKRFDDQ